MRRTVARTLAAALVAAPVLVATAPAARASTCPLLLDAAGDATIQPAGAALGSRTELDIRSADLASGTNDVVVVLRLTSLSPDPNSTRGAAWGVVWQINGTHYGVSLRRDVLGTYYAEFTGSTTSGPAYAVDVANATITWEFARSALPDLATAGQTFDHIAASTSLLNTAVDAGFTTQTYVDQTAGCVSAP